MPGTRAAIVAVYRNHASAEAALNALRDKGFATTEISVVAPCGVETAAAIPEPETPSSEPPPAGSVTIPAVGVALGWLVGIGAVAVSGAMFVAAGPILVAFKGMSDAVLGVVDALVEFGIPADAAKKYEDRVREGAILLTVHAEDVGRLSRGREIFEQTAAEDILSTYENERTGAAVPDMTPAAH